MGVAHSFPNGRIEIELKWKRERETERECEIRGMVHRSCGEAKITNGWNTKERIL